MLQICHPKHSLGHIRTDKSGAISINSVYQDLMLDNGDHPMRISLNPIATSIGALAFTISIGSFAFAQSASQPDELQAIYSCKSISDPQERLACYDNSVGRFEAAEKSGAVVTVSKTAIEKVERDAFGFNIPSLPSLGGLFGGGSKKTVKENDLTAPVKKASIPKEPSSSVSLPKISKPEPSDITDVNLTVRKTTEFGRGKTRFFMTNGQVWEQVGSIRGRIPKVKEGKTTTAEISKAALGSFFLRVNGKGGAIRVRRVR